MDHRNNCCDTNSTTDVVQCRQPLSLYPYLLMIGMPTVQHEDAAGYRSAMAAVGSALMCGGASMLAGGSVASEGLEGELTEKLADALAEFGAAHLHCLPTNETRLAFLQQVCLLYARNYGV